MFHCNYTDVYCHSLKDLGGFHGCFGGFHGCFQGFRGLKTIKPSKLTKPTEPC
jgi:hypothetical protein